MSRTELLEWLNQTLDLDYTKVEKCGTGAAFCLIMNSIYHDIPLQKLKFNATGEYDYRVNWKILQSSFNKHNVTKVIDVNRLMKCRLQDNLELLQWLKKYWEDHDGGLVDMDMSRERNVDADKPSETRSVSANDKKVSGNASESRKMSDGRRSSNFDSRRSSGIDRKVSNDRNSVIKDNNRNSTINGANSYKAAVKTSNSRVPSGGSNNGGVPFARSTPNELAALKNQYSAISEELQEYKLSADSLETERNFYFNKLRDIEILTQNIIDLSTQNKLDELGDFNAIELTKRIQGILYSTQEGFQLNDNDESF